MTPADVMVSHKEVDVDVAAKRLIGVAKVSERQPSGHGMPPL